VGRAVGAEKLAWWFSLAVIAIAGIAPIALMTIESVWHGGRLSLDNYRQLTIAARLWPLLFNSVAIAGATTALCGLVGVPLGLLFSKSDIPGRFSLMWILAVPFVLPPYFMALAWTRLLVHMGFSSQPLFGFGGCILVLTSVFLPITMLLTFASSSSVDRRLEEAARLVSPWTGVLRHITIPLSTPGVLFSFVLVFLLSIGEFSVPNFLRIPTLPVLSFTEFTASYNFGAATAAASPLALVAFAGAIVETALIRDRVFSFRSTGNVLKILPLGGWKTLSLLVVVFWASVFVIAPLLALVSDGLSGPSIAEAIRRGCDSLVRSLSYSATAATILTALGFLIAYFMRQTVNQLLPTLTLALLSIPGTVLAIGLVRLWNTPSTWFIYATPVLLILGYIAQYSAVTARSVLAGLMLVPSSLDEAARISGASWVTRVTRIWIPLSWKALACAWLAAYILCLRDVPIAMVAAPAGHDVLPARILTLMANGSPSLISSLCLMMIVAALLPLVILTFVARRRASGS
jgi:iron(III) transport system permease protein